MNSLRAELAPKQATTAAEKLAAAATHCTCTRPPSAIATFSHLILSLDSKCTSPSKRSARHRYATPSTVASLPTEVLRCSFFHSCSKHASPHAVRETMTHAGWHPGSKTTPCHPPSFHIHLPPCAPGGCKLWPPFPSTGHAPSLPWTFLSHRPLPFETMLEWVGDRPLQAIVTKHHGTPEEPDLDDYTHVQTVLCLLQPHICHTRSLAFDTKHSSSLPALWRERGFARNLRLSIE
ncbi:hypothetical protein J3R83DRAFT_2780 [Lanmaoa asiatica]|nr:hypothetical protein J3R83DRAFT_2780 [Lanmaoa asiatica]